jgi:hypothetical protein
MLHKRKNGCIFARSIKKVPIGNEILIVEKIIAKIAQLVEHNLAKVRVASSSLVIRSLYKGRATPLFFVARVVESVDTQDLKSCDH